MATLAELSGEVIQFGMRKRACTTCKHRKIRCSGELPSCARCVRLIHECHYPPRRRLGRPKRHVEPPRTPDLTVGGTGLHPITPDPSSPWAVGEMSGHDDGEGRDLIDGHPQSQPQPHPPTPPMCACISILYLALDELRGIRHLDFPGGLPPLRAALSSAADALACQVCPTRFLSAMQNAHLIGVVLITAAECYSRILHSLDSGREDRVDDDDEYNNHPSARRTVDLHAPINHGRGDEPSSASASMSFTLDLDEVEWTRLAKRALANEIHGPPPPPPNDDNDNTLVSTSGAGAGAGAGAGVGVGVGVHFTTILNGLVRRQVLSHSTHPPADAPAHYQTTTTTGTTGTCGNDGPERPACLLVAMEARRLIDALDFG